MIQSVLNIYGLQKNLLTMEKFGSGLINHTWKITTPDKNYILQRVNHQVFSEPENISSNISQIAAYLQLHHPEYSFAAPVISNTGLQMIYVKDEGYFRMFPFVLGSHSKNIVETPEQAFEAAAQFARFTKMLSGFNIDKLKITIPQFHDLSLRYQQFLDALQKGNKERILETAELIQLLKNNRAIADEYEKIKSNSSFKLRVTHHDTKISNVLFNAEDKGICVIDLDTVMPGYYISDVGDMMRTYLSPVDEEEKDFSKIEIREEFYKAIVEGYYSEMKEELSEIEKQYFFYAGKFIIYMQSLRFLTDYLNDDVYYGAAYEGQNFIRAKNQLTLLQKLIEKEPVLSQYI